MTRRTYHYDQATGQMVEGPGPRRVDGPSGDGYRFSDRLYSDNPFVGQGGELIDSRRKHREYMRKYGLTTIDDFKPIWDKAAEKRADFYSGWREDAQNRKRDIAQSIERLESGQKSRSR